MHSQEITIKAYEDRFREPMISLWERSVSATHHFLKSDDFDYFREIVKEIDFKLFVVHCLLANDKVVGFLGVADKKIEMLFLDPPFIGRGLGKKLMHFALSELEANKVVVNEQNEMPVKF